ncbi:MAG: bacterial Ig-like domain-containing protein [Bacilli bacterium]|nr:bacterial Ig-like domain-containing protein [Bacilli bacterium]
MNRFQKRIMIIAAAICNVSLTLTAAGVATYAWFKAKANLVAVSNNLSISVADPDEKFEYDIYKYDDNLKAGKKFTDPSDFTLPDYDTYITEKNVYANCIIRAEVTVPSLNTSDEYFTIDVTRLASNYFITSTTKVDKKTSNVIQLKSAVYSFLESGETDFTENTNMIGHGDIDETSPATIYSTVSDYFATKQTPTTFVPIRYDDNGNPIVNRGDDENKRTITLIPDLPTGYTITKVIIYLECSYHEDLVDKYVESNSTDSAATKYALQGDVSSIVFSHKEKVAKTSQATGKYIKVESTAALANGQYLHAYETDESTGAAKLMKGSLATSDKAATNPSGIFVADNIRDATINSLPSNEPKSIDTTDAIDSDAFAYTKKSGENSINTFKSKAGYYIGNDTQSNGIATNDDYANGYKHQITFSGDHANVDAYGTGSNNMRLGYYTSGNGRFYYQKDSGKQTDLFRYTENVAEMPTLTGIEITTATTATSFYTSQKFAITNLVVTATYSNDSSAIVTKSCTFTSDTDPATLVPGTTTLSTVTQSKNIYVSYSEGGVTINGEGVAALTYTISVAQDELNSISATAPTKSYYFVNEEFSSAGMTVTAHYKSGNPVNIELNNPNLTITAPSMSSVSDPSVNVSYTDGVTKSTTVTIHIVARYLSINKNSASVAEGGDVTITVDHNQDVTITNTPGTGTVSLNPSSIEYTGTNKARTTTDVTVHGETAGTVTLTFSSSGCSPVSCNITVTATPADVITMTADEVITDSGYKAYATNISKDYNGTGSESKGWLVTFGGNNYTFGTNNNATNFDNCNLSSYDKYAVSTVATTSETAAAFANTSVMHKIRNISFTCTGGTNLNTTTAYIIYSADNITFSKPTLASGSTSQGTTVTSGTTYTFKFNSALAGYFAIVFKSSLSSVGNWKIEGLSVTYNPKALDHIAITGDVSNKSYTSGQSLNMSGLVVTAYYTDNTNEVVTGSATLTSSVDPLTTGTTSVTVTASYTFGSSTETATKSVTGLTVTAPSTLITAITLTAASSSIVAGNTTTVTIGITPSSASSQNITVTLTAGGGTYGRFDNSTGSTTTKDVQCSSGSGSFTVYGVAAGSFKLQAAANDGSSITSNQITITVTAPSSITFTTNRSNLSPTWSSSGTYTVTSSGETITFSNLTASSNSDIQMAKNSTATSTEFSGNISQIILYGCAHTGSKSDGSFTVSGSANGSSWTEVYSISNMSPSQGNITISVSSGYKYFKVTVGSSRVLKITGIKVTYS